MERIVTPREWNKLETQHRHRRWQEEEIQKHWKLFHRLFKMGITAEEMAVSGLIEHQRINL